MIYMRLFTILLAASFMVIVFYGDLATVTSLLAGLCGGFVAVVAAQNNTIAKLKTLEKRNEIRPLLNWITDGRRFKLYRPPTNHL